MKLLLPILASLFCFGSAGAADTPPANEPLTWYEQIGRDFAAPIRQPGLPYTLIGTGLTLASLPVKNTDFESNIAQHKPLGTWASAGYQLGLWKINLAYFVGFMGYGLLANDTDAVKNSWRMFRATAYTGLVTTAIKEIGLEERPRKNGDLKSFPSGHASNAFAFAGTVYRNHGWIFGAPAFLMAGFVSYSRMNDNAHYLNDLIAGATIGLAYSMGLDSDWHSKDEAKTVAVIPIVQSTALGLGAVIDF